MLPIGFVITWLGYGFGTWGFILVKGYNISLREWFSPLHPYTGPLAAAGTVPQGQVFPSGGSGGTTTSTAASGQTPPVQQAPSGQGSNL